MNRKLCLLALIIAVLATAIVKAQTEQAASISGRVTMSGAPARGIKVSLVPGPYSSPETPGRQSVKTDDEGRYEFSGLAAGRYGILAASYVNVSDEFWQFEFKPFKLCTVAAGEKLEHQDIRMVRGGVITGRVTAADGKPVINERVNLSLVDRNGKRLAYLNFFNDEVGLTDDRGVYRYFCLPTGRYLVSVGREVGGGAGSASSRGFYRRVYYPGVHDAERAELIEVNEGSETTGIDFKLEPMEKTFSVSGRMVDENGQLALGSLYDLSIFEKATSRWRGWTAGDSLNDRAEFYVSGLLPGQYALNSFPFPGRNTYSDFVTFEIKDEDVEGLEIKELRGGIISGTVVVEGVADPVAALGEAKAFLRPVSLEASILPRRFIVYRPQTNGNFEVKALPPGKIRLEVISENNKLHLVRIERSGTELTEAFDLKPAEQVTGVRIVMAEAAGALRGRLVLPAPLPDGWQMNVKVRRADSGDLHEQQVTPDAALSFLLQLVAGDYEIIVTLNNRKSGDAAIEAARSRVSVRNGATTEVSLPIEFRR